MGVIGPPAGGGRGRLRGQAAAGMCRHFLDAVRSGPRLDAGDALATHELCERVVTGL